MKFIVIHETTDWDVFPNGQFAYGPFDSEQAANIFAESRNWHLSNSYLTHYVLPLRETN